MASSKEYLEFIMEQLAGLVSIPGLVTPVSGPSETSIPGNRKP